MTFLDMVEIGDIIDMVGGCSEKEEEEGDCEGRSKRPYALGSLGLKKARVLMSSHFQGRR